MIDSLVTNPSAREVIDTVNEVVEAVNTGGAGGVPEAPVDTKVYGRQDADWVEVTGGSGMTAGSIVLNVPSEYATFSLALAAAKTLSYSGRITINFEAGFVLTEPLWFDDVNIQNLDVTVASSPLSVNATTFPALIAGVYKAVVGGQDSKIGRISGTFNVTTGDSGLLLASFGSDFDFTAGQNNYIGTTVGLSITGTTLGAAYINSNIRGEGTFTIPTSSGVGNFEITGGAIDNLNLSFGGDGIIIGAIPAFSISTPTNCTFNTITLTGSSCRVEILRGTTDIGALYISPNMFFGFSTQSATVNCAIPSSSFRTQLSYGPAFNSSGGSLNVQTSGTLTWRPYSEPSLLVASDSVGKCGVTITGDLVIDNTDCIPNEIMRANYVGDSSLIYTGGITGSYGKIGNIPINFMTTTNSTWTNVGSIIRCIGGNLDETQWTAATLLNSWVNIAGKQGAEYRKIGDVVWVRFAIEDGTTSTLFNLPVGLRPLNDTSVYVNAHDNTNAPDYGHLVIQTNGDVVLEHPGSLSGHSVYATFQFSVL